MAWNIQESFDCKWDISRVVKLEFVRNLGVCQLLIEPFIFVFCYLPLLPVPDSLQTVNLMSIQSDGVADKLGKLLNDLLYFILLREFSAISSQFKSDLGTSIEIKI